MSIYWDREMVRGFALEQRLTKLDRPRATSFAAGCVEHIVQHFDVIYRTKCKNQLALAPFRDVWQQGLRECWSAVSAKRAPNGVSDQIKAIDNLFIDPNVLESAIAEGADNIDQITGAVYKALECAKSFGHTGYAMGAAQSAYEAVLLWYVMRNGESVTWTEDESLRQQSNCAECNAEITFQKRYIQTLEGNQVQPPLYSLVVQEMGNGA
jgi:hypothetical protein